MIISADVNELLNYVTKTRRLLHTIPEVDFNLEKTHNYIISQLKKMDICEVTEVSKTGIKAIIRAEGAKQTLAFRADMDALSTTEENKVNYCSKNKGFMHACGHDGHMACLLGFAKLIKNNISRLRCNVVLIFQPAEETTGGAQPMIEEGIMDNPKIDEIYCIHMYPGLEEGNIGITSGPVMAQNCEFDIQVEGKSCHGAQPHLGKDALVASCNIVTSIQVLRSRMINQLNDCIITIGAMSSGKQRNILSDYSVLKGIIRTYNEDLYYLIRDGIIRLLNATDDFYGTKSEYKEEVYFPPVINDDNLVKKVRRLVGDNSVNINRQMLSDDFSFFQKKAPGVYMFLGCRNVSKNFIHPLHNSRFDFDEKSLLYGIELFKRLVLDV